MRKLDKEHLKIILWIVLGIALVIYIPYGLAYTDIFFKHFSYTYVPPQAIPIPPPGSGTVYYSVFQDTEIPHWNLMLMAWFEGALKLLSFGMVLIGILLIGLIGYYSFDWLFPKIETRKPYDPDKDGK